MNAELILPFAKTAARRFTSGELFNQDDLKKLGIQYVGLITHPENPGVAFERIILGEPMPDTQRTVFHQDFEKELVMHLDTNPNHITGNVGFLDFVQVSNQYGDRDLQKKYGKEIHITYAGIEVKQRGQFANRRLFEGLKLIAKKRGANYISATIHNHRLPQLFPIFARLGFKKGTTLNNGLVKISYDLES